MTLSDIPNEILLAPEQVKRPTDSRLPSASNGRQGLIQLLKEDEPRSYERAIVKGCLDGNQPYVQKTLNNNGQRWRCNLNFRGLEGTMDSARIPYYALFSGVPQYAVFRTRYEASNPESQIWNDIISQNFTCMLKRWKSFNWHMQSSQFEMLFEGWGPLIFEDDSDWRFRSIPARSFLVPQDSPSCLDARIPYFVVRCEYRVHELYKKIKNEDGASKRGWNVKAVKNAIKFGTRSVSGDPQSWQYQPWEEWQKRFKDKTLVSSYTEMDIIRCAHLYVQEYTGKVSHFIITESSIPTGDTEKDAEDWFLFKDVNKYDSYDQIANVAFQNTGDGSWHSVRGVGLKSYGYEEVQNRLNCRIVDNANLASMMILQAGDGQSKQKAQLYINGAVGIIPPGTILQQNRLGGDIPQVMGVTRMLENKLANKIGAFNQRSITREDGRGEKATATEIEAAAAKEGSLSAAQIDNYYLDLDCLYTEVFRRAKSSSDPEAKRFVQDCLDAGVPRKALDDMEYVRANRASGYGSPQMRSKSMDDLMALYPTLPEQGKKNALNAIISAKFGPDNIQVFNPPMEKVDSDDWMADMEQEKLEAGAVPPITSGMDHVVHLNIHLQHGEEQLNPLKEAMDAGEELEESTLNQATSYVAALGEHSEAHLSFIENDPGRKQLAEYFSEKLDQLTSFHGKLRSAVRAAKARAAQAAREQEQIVALSALDQAKLQSKQQEMQIKAVETEQSMAIKQRKADQQLANNERKARTSSRLEAVKTVEQIRLDRIKTAAEVQKKNQQSLNRPKTSGSKSK